MPLLPHDCCHVCTALRLGTKRPFDLHCKKLLCFSGKDAADRTITTSYGDSSRSSRQKIAHTSTGAAGPQCCCPVELLTTHHYCVLPSAYHQQRHRANCHHMVSIPHITVLELALSLYKLWGGRRHQRRQERMPATPGWRPFSCQCCWPASF